MNLKKYYEGNRGLRRNPKRITSSSISQNELGISPLNLQRKKAQKLKNDTRRYTFSSQLKVLKKVSMDLKESKPVRNLMNQDRLRFKNLSRVHHLRSSFSLGSEMSIREEQNLSVASSHFKVQNVKTTSQNTVFHNQMKLKSNFKMPYNKTLKPLIGDSPKQQGTPQNTSITPVTEKQTQNHKQKCKLYKSNVSTFDFLGKRVNPQPEERNIYSRKKQSHKIGSAPRKLLKVVPQNSKRKPTFNPILGILNEVKIPSKRVEAKKTQTELHTPSIGQNRKPMVAVGVNSTSQKVNVQVQSFDVNNSGVNIKNIDTPDSLKIDPYVAAVNRLKHYIQNIRTQTNILIDKIPHLEGMNRTNKLKLKKKDRLKFVAKM